MTVSLSLLCRCIFAHSLNERKSIVNRPNTYHNIFQYAGKFKYSLIHWPRGRPGAPIRVPRGIHGPPLGSPRTPQKIFSHDLSPEYLFGRAFGRHLVSKWAFACFGEARLFVTWTFSGVLHCFGAPFHSRHR